MGRRVILPAFIFILLCHPHLPAIASSAEQAPTLQRKPIIQQPLGSDPCRPIQFITPALLPPATPAKPYRRQLSTSGGDSAVTYRLIKGALPPGFKLDSRGNVDGVAKTSGTYQFVIRAQSSCPTHANRMDRAFTLRIHSPVLELEIQPRPATMNVPAGATTKRSIHYAFINPSARGVRLHSAGAAFMANKTIIGELKKPMTAGIQGKTGSAAETLIISPEVTEKAVSMGAHTIAYVRHFTIGSTRTRRTAQVIITIKRKQADIVRELELSFEKKRTNTTIRQGMRPPKPIATIFLSRPGTVTGYWEMDGKPVTPAVTHKAGSRRIAIGYPAKAPPLSMLPPGRHNLRFVIRDPETKIKLPNLLLTVPAPKTTAPSPLKEDQPIETFLPGQVLVMTRTTVGVEAYLARKYQLKTVESFILQSLKRRVTVFSTSGNVAEVIKQIKKEQAVLQVQPNHVFRTLSEPHHDMQHVNAGLNLDDVHQRYKGRGVRVAIVDTGVDIRHRDLSDRVVKHVNLLRNNLYRGEIHGTAIAGVMLASINQYGIAGVAPQADLIALRACRQVSENHPEGRCTTTSVSKALDVAIEEKAHVVNMSFGASVPDGLMMQILNEGAGRGVLFVAPVGNRKEKKEISFPASHSKVIAVGGIDQRGGAYPNDALASAAMVCAPAEAVLTTLPGNRHNLMSGTSISAAIVSGLLALAKERNRGLGIVTLPPYPGDLCNWQEALINWKVCK